MTSNSDGPFLQRTCKVRPNGSDDPPSDLIVAFSKPLLREDSPSDFPEYQGQVTIACAHFETTLSLVGSDEIQALMGGLLVAQAYLTRKASEGYAIYWLAEGDLAFSDFWFYRK